MQSNLVELGNYVKITSGYAFKSNLFNEDEVGMPLIRIRDVTSGVVKTYFSGEYQEQYIVEPGDLLITMDGEFKIKKWHGEKALLNQRVCKIESNSELLETDYLLYMLPAILKRIEDRTAFVTVKHLSVKEIQKSILNLPDIKTQKQIVEVLNETASIIKKRQSQITALDELTQSLFLEMFGDPVTNPKEWQLKTLKDFGEWKSGGTPSRSNKKYYSGKIPWLSSGELNDIYVESSSEFITEEAVKESATKFIEEGSILLGMYDTAALKSSIVKMRCTCNQAIAFAKLDEEKISTVYIYKYIQLAKDHLKRQQRGVRQKNMNLSMIKELRVMYPPIQLQREFEENFKLIQEKKALFTDSLEHLNMLYNVLLQKAFKGELFQD